MNSVVKEEEDLEVESAMEEASTSTSFRLTYGPMLDAEACDHVPHRELIH